MLRRKQRAPRLFGLTNLIPKALANKKRRVQAKGLVRQMCQSGTAEQPRRFGADKPVLAINQSGF